MDSTPIQSERGDAIDAQAEAERQFRLDWEVQGIAKARSSAAAGRVVDSSKVKAWIDSIGTDHELPVPYSGR